MMTIQELAEKLKKKFNVEDRDIDWLLQQTTVETALLTACEDRLGVVMKLVSPAAWADYERILGAARADYQRITAPTWADYERIQWSAWADYERIQGPAMADYKLLKDAARMELLTALEKE